jgi:hypothetical protein
LSARTHHRARVAALPRSRTADDPELIDARRDLAAAKLAAYVKRVVAEAPPLTPAQVDELTLLFRPDGAEAGDQR